MHTLLAILILAQAPPPKAAFDYQARANLIAPYVDTATVAIARVDVTQLNVDTLLTELSTLHPAQAKALAPLMSDLRQSVRRFTQAGGKELYAVLSLSDLALGSGLPVFLVAPVAAGVEGKAVAAALAGSIELAETAEVRGNVVLAGRKTTLTRLRTLKPDKRPELTQAFGLAGDTTAQLLLLPPAHARRLLEETYPTLPRELGGGPTAALTRGFLWGALAVEVTPNLALRGVIQARDAKSAQALADLRRGILNALLESTLKGELPFKTVLLADPFKPKVIGDQLRLSLDGDQLRATVAPFVLQAVAEVDRNRHMHNLKQLGLALHNYHDNTQATFPAVGNFDKQGKPLLSWRVHILPYIEQETLYQQFKLDEPWDSAHNKKLITQMPVVFRSSASKASAGMTNYLAPVSTSTIFTGGPKGVKINDITDGTSTTILLVEADDDHAAIWTKPDDWKIDAASTAKGLRVYPSKVFLALFADGSVRFLPADLDEKTLQALFTRNGGEAVNVP